MTAIGAATLTPMMHSFAGSARSTPDAFAEATAAQQDKLVALLAAERALKQSQFGMSNSEYLHAKFAIQEQIGAERLSRGADLDVFTFRHEGRTYDLAGKMLDASSLKATRLTDQQRTDLFDLRASAPSSIHPWLERGLDISA